MSLKSFIEKRGEDIADWLLTNFVAKPFCFLFSRLEKYITYKRPKYPVRWYSLKESIESCEFYIASEDYWNPYYTQQSIYYKRVDEGTKGAIKGTLNRVDNNKHISGVGEFYFAPITDCFFDGRVTPEYYATNKDKIYTIDISYKDEPKSFKRRYLRRWHRMRRHVLWYFKHVLENGAEYGDARPLEYDGVWEYYHIARMKQIWCRAFPYRAFYTEPAALPMVIEDQLFKFAVYCFYTGHTTSNKEMIRKCWSLRKELRSIGKEESVYKKEKMAELSEEFSKKYGIENHFLKLYTYCSLDTDCPDNMRKTLFSDGWYIVSPLSCDIKFTSDELYDEWTKIPETKGKVDNFLDSSCLERPEEALAWVKTRWSELSKEYYDNLHERVLAKKKEVFELIASEYEKLWD